MPKLWASPLVYGLLRFMTPPEDSYDKEIRMHEGSILLAVAEHELSITSHSGRIP